MDRTTEIDVEGMTCTHCVSAVTAEVSGIDGVSDVSVVLRKGGLSTVTAVSMSPLDADALRAAVDEAGYTARDIRVAEN